MCYRNHVPNKKDFVNGKQRKKRMPICKTYFRHDFWKISYSVMKATNVFLLEKLIKFGQNK